MRVILLKTNLKGIFAFYHVDYNFPKFSAKSVRIFAYYACLAPYWLKCSFKMRHKVALASPRISPSTTKQITWNTILSAYWGKLSMDLKQKWLLWAVLTGAQMAPGQTVLFLVIDELDSFYLIQRCELNGQSLPKNTPALGNNLHVLERPRQTISLETARRYGIPLNYCVTHLLRPSVERIAFHSRDVWFYYRLKNKPNKCSYWFAH